MSDSANLLDAEPDPPDPVEIPEDRLDLRVLSAIRRIMRATDMFSRRLATTQGITAPQLLCLSRVTQTGGITIKDLARDIYLSPSTVVGIVDRLEARGLVERVRSKPDKRLVRVTPTEAAKVLVEQSPSPLHENLVSGFRELPEGDQRRITAAVEDLVAILELEKVEAAPILETKAELDGPLG